MSLVFEKQKNTTFIPAPEGMHLAVCADVQDLGLFPKVWEGKQILNDDGTPTMIRECRIVWELAVKQKNDKPFTVANKYSFSLGKKANLVKMLTKWVGAPKVGFDLDSIIGVPCQILVVHNVDKDDPSVVYANIESVIKAQPDQKLAVSSDFVRMKDRKDS